jgi:hypothetical protein
MNITEKQNYSDRAKLPTIRRMIWNVCVFTFSIFLISSILLTFGMELALVVPFLFTWKVIRPLFYNYTYDYKAISITKSDRRYTTGQKTIGYRYVKDKNSRFSIHNFK